MESTEPTTPARPERLLRREHVLHRIGINTSQLYRLMGEGRFPRPISLGRRWVAWPESTVDAWIAERIRAAVEEQ